MIKEKRKDGGAESGGMSEIAQSTEIQKSKEESWSQ